MGGSRTGFTNRNSDKNLYTVIFPIIDEDSYTVRITQSLTFVRSYVVGKKYS